MTAGRITIGIVHPAPRRSRTGNRVTALRWASILRRLGHRVFVERRWSGRPCDLLVALHASKTLDSMRAFRSAHPETPLIVAGTGTDLYEPSGAGEAEGLGLATRVIVLQPLALESLPSSVRARGRVLYQSVRLPHDLPGPTAGENFEVAVIANLREVKDPLLPARACALLPSSSHVSVLHAGGILDARLGREAHQLAASEPRYTFLGELAHHAALQLLARARVIVLPSRNEGGANVLSEALALGQPVLATRIPGVTGLLGDDHPGLFEVGDANALATCLLRAECEPAFLEELKRRSRGLAPLVAPEREERDWRTLLRELLPV